MSVLRELHDELEAAVFAAYGWPVTLSDEELLERLVALNAERAAEEQRGLVRWLRPEYQNPAGDSALAPAERDEDEPAAVDTPAAKPAPAARRSWPATLPEQAQAVRAALAAAAAPATAEDLARRCQGARTDRVEALLETLAALGQARQVAPGRYSPG